MENEAEQIEFETGSVSRLIAFPVIFGSWKTYSTKKIGGFVI